MLPNSNMFKIINSILILIAIVSFAFLANTFIRNQAIDGCAQNYRYSVVLSDQNANVTYPMAELYKQCLKDKGIK